VNSVKFFVERRLGVGQVKFIRCGHSIQACGQLQQYCHPPKEYGLVDFCHQGP